VTSCHEQGVLEAVSDYGWAHSLILYEYLAGRFVTFSRTDFHDDPSATNLEGLQALRVTSGIP
jgi:hypothetical protein